MAKKLIKHDLAKFLPVKPDETYPLQAHIDKEIFDAANDARKDDGLKWPELIEGLLKAYLSQRGVK